ALHTFTFANAVHQGLRRIPSVELVRGVFDAAMSIYLDRYLNIPPAPLPEPHDVPGDTDALLATFPIVLDRPQQVNEAGELVARYLAAGGAPERLLAAFGSNLLREDRDFHTIQAIEAAVSQFVLRPEAPEGVHMLVGAARYLAAHTPTLRTEGQTYQIAYRLHRGERLYAEPDRILATVLFADMVGSTARAAELGDHQWRSLLRNYHALIGSELARFRGHLIETAGDGCLARFDAPAGAIRCALAIHRAVQRLGLQTRAGLHTSEIEIMEDRVSGIGVHIGARVAALAGPGETLVTATVKDLVTGSGIRFEDRGSHLLKGVPDEWRVFAVMAR
ncbi:MAG: adenylate/guanylate cyclase domain-containing protein, partial [bacterium]